MSRDERPKMERSHLDWAVIGVGVAGRARSKAIGADPRAKLAGVYRGRFAAETGARELSSFEEVLSIAEAVAVCSPTAEHAAQVERILDAGRHALVEFPLAEDAATAERLFDKARAKGLVLHEEHIELLDAPTATLRAHIRPSIVRSVSVSFEGPGPEGASAGALALGNTARIHRALAFAGRARAVLHIEHVPGKLDAELSLVEGGSLKLCFQMAPYFQRRTTIDADTVAGRWTQQDDQLMRERMPVTLVGTGGLFNRDQRAATARILDGSEHYIDEASILHVMDIVDCLRDGSTGELPLREGAHTDGDSER